MLSRHTAILALEFFYFCLERFVTLLSGVSPPSWYCNLSGLFLIRHWTRRRHHPQHWTTNGKTIITTICRLRGCIPVCPALPQSGEGNRVRSSEANIAFFFSGSACESRSSPKAIKSRQSWRQMEVPTRNLRVQMAQARKKPCWDRHRGRLTWGSH